MRKLITSGLFIVILASCTSPETGPQENEAYIYSVHGKVGIENLGISFTHEHVMSRFALDPAYEASIEEIAQIWIDEFENGIDETGIQPGFIKLAFDQGASEIDVKLFTAGILTHLSTGLTMVVHTENNMEAVEKQLELLDRYGVSPDAWVWVHASKAEDDNVLVETAKKGGWISLDKFKSEETDDYVSRLKYFREKELLHKVLLSHDGNSFNRDGALKEYHAVLTHLVPALKENGFSEEDIHQLLVINPQNAFKIE